MNADLISHTIVFYFLWLYFLLSGTAGFHTAFFRERGLAQGAAEVFIFEAPRAVLWSVLSALPCGDLACRFISGAMWRAGDRLHTRILTLEIKCQVAVLAPSLQQQGQLR